MLQVRPGPSQSRKRIVTPGQGRGKARYSTAKYSNGDNSALFRLTVPTRESDCGRASASGAASPWSYSQRHDNLEEL